MAEWSFIDTGDVIDENDDVVACVVQREHGELLATAPQLLEALRAAESFLRDRFGHAYAQYDAEGLHALSKVSAALSLATSTNKGEGV